MGTTAQRLGEENKGVQLCWYALAYFPRHNKVLQTEGLNSRKSRAHSSRVWKSEIRALVFRVRRPASGEGCLSSVKATLLLHPGMTLLGCAQVERESTHRLLGSLLPRALTMMDPLT